MFYRNIGICEFFFHTFLLQPFYRIFSDTFFPQQTYLKKKSHFLELFSILREWCNAGSISRWKGLFGCCRYMVQTWSENVYLVDVCPLLHLPTVTHSALPSPVQSVTSHFHCSLGSWVLHITLSKDCLFPDESCSSAVTVTGLPLGHPCTPSHPHGKLLPGEWEQLWQLGPTQPWGWNVGQSRTPIGAASASGQNNLGEERWGRDQLYRCFRTAWFPWQPLQSFPPWGGCHKETVDIATASWRGDGVVGGVVMGVDVTTTPGGEGGRRSLMVICGGQGQSHLSPRAWG